MRCLYSILGSVLLLLCMQQALADPVNFVPNWRSYTQTRNPGDLVRSDVVAAAIGRKIDAINGQMQNPSIQGGSASGLDVTASMATAFGASVPQTLADHLGRILSPRDFGAQCNGKTDDHLSLSIAFSYVMATGSSLTFPSGRFCINNAPINVAVGSGNIVDINFNKGGVVTTNGSDFLVFDGSNIPKMSGFNIHDGVFFDTAGKAKFVTVQNAKEFFGYFQSSIHDMSVPNKDPRDAGAAIVQAGAGSLFFGQNVGHFSIYRNYGSYSAAFTEFTGVAKAAGSVGSDQYSSDSDVYDNSVQGVYTQGSVAVRIHDHVQGIFVSRNRFLTFGYGVYMAPADNAGSEGMEIIDNGLNVKYGGIWIQGGLNIISRNNLQAAADASFIGYSIGSATASSVYSVITDNGANSLGSQPTQATPVYLLYVSDGSVVAGNQTSGIWHGSCMTIVSPTDTVSQSTISNNNCWQSGGISISGSWNGGNNVYNTSVGSSTTVNLSNIPNEALTSVTPPKGVFYINGLAVVKTTLQANSLVLGTSVPATANTPASYTNLAYFNSDPATHNIAIGDATAANTYGGQLLMQAYTKSTLLSKVKGAEGGMVLCSDCAGGNAQPVIYSGGQWVPVLLGTPLAP
ncbi:hypothetical protein [Gluconobacter cerinus]|uniref:hypothetical protein n=1 Tax=Gluconobacter cerinus TaxID=38307 RepID=UPI001B8D00E5|nr:hypothetical protein [Gluconobacter cerinus]MBS1044479.1 hypothetical protein [Gluconobacter cerinus]